MESQYRIIPFIIFKRENITYFPLPITYPGEHHGIARRERVVHGRDMERRHAGVTRHFGIVARARARRRNAGSIRHEHLTARGTVRGCRIVQWGEPTGIRGACHEPE